MQTPAKLIDVRWRGLFARYDIYCELCVLCKRAFLTLTHSPFTASFICAKTFLNLTLILSDIFLVAFAIIGHSANIYAPPSFSRTSSTYSILEAGTIMDKYKGFDPPSKHPDQLIELPPPTSSNPNLKVEYSKDRHFAQQLGDLTKEQIRQDLEAMGFTKERTEEMFSREETIVDGFAQLPNYSQGFVHKDPAKRPRPRNDNDKKLVGNMKKTAYKHLVIDDRYPSKLSCIMS